MSKRVQKWQILKFIKLRNESQHTSNLQFMFDLEKVGLSSYNLPTPTKRIDKYLKCEVLYWELPFGIMVERLGNMRLFTRRKNDNS